MEHYAKRFLGVMDASLAFEKWVKDMKNQLGLGGDNRELIVTLPNGVKVDFDLAKSSEKEAYESLMGQVGGAKIAESAPARAPHAHSNSPCMGHASPLDGRV